jgi:pyruvate dehydrogenase E2 component (dihydrolipoyllysine-residue acetyltransferase)
MAETINMPKLGFDMAEGTLVRWVKKEGETINKGDVLAEIETDKATVEVESSASGVVRKLLVDEGAVVPISTPIAVVGTAEEKIELPTAAPAESKPALVAAPSPEVASGPVSQPASEPAPTLVQQSAEVKASPLAKRLAREQSVDLKNIQGSGPGGRVVRRDIEKALTGQPVPSGVAPVIPAQPVIATGMRLSDRTVPMSKLRQAIARRMAESKTTIPHFYVTHEYNVSALLELRKQVNATLGENERISVNDFIIKAVALTLHQFPNLNASLAGNSYQLHGPVNIGVAVSVEGGLLTVVCRDADLKSLSQISTEVKSMAAHVREGKVRPEEIEGSTFSISNMGMYDVENFSAIINHPEAAILAVGSAREVPVVEAGEVKPGWRMKATIAVDHRVSDGVEAAKFMQALAIYLETPLKMFI